MIAVDRKTAMKVIAANVSGLMETKGLGVRELGRSADVEPIVISRLLRTISLPGVDAIYRIAIALGVSVDSLIGTAPNGDGRKNSKKSA